MNDNETGRVKKIVNNRALVECEAVNMCNNCMEKERCNISGEGKKREIWIDNVPGIAAGDRIQFSIKDGGIIYASVLLYFIPVVFLFLGMITGYKLHGFLNIDIELSAIIFGAVFLIMSFIFIKIYSKFILHKEGFKAIFIKKVD